jgi:multidrug resistance efflux pump
VRVALQEFSGSLKVEQVAPVLRSGGRVEQGVELLRLDRAPLERELRAAREALASARLAHQLLERDQKLEEAEARQALEQAELAAQDAARALERFEKVELPAAQKNLQLDLQASLNMLEDAREELSQLEAMYKGTQLATETKEIVLERARRDLRVSEERLALARTRARAVEEYEHPQQLRTHRDQARWTAADLQRAREKAGVEAERRRDALETSGRGLRDAEERLARLEGDLAAVARFVAPVSGLLAAAPEVRPGDVIDPQAPLSWVHEGALVARFQAAEEDLRVLAPGGAARVTLSAFGETPLAGAVEAVADLPAEGEEGRLVTVGIVLGGEHAHLRCGLACRVEVPGPKLSGVLSVPRGAVEVHDGRPSVQVWKDGEASRREVVLGAGSRERVVVLSGLTAGEQVVVPEEGQ